MLSWRQIGRLTVNKIEERTDDSSVIEEVSEEEDEVAAGQLYLLVFKILRLSAQDQPWKMKTL